MRWVKKLAVISLAVFLLASFAPSATTYRVRNPELGIVYRPNNWDLQQWDEVFRDPNPPMGWVIVPIGRESCSAITSWWRSNAQDRGFKTGILLDPFLTDTEIKKTIDCAVPLGIKRAMLDEYVSYHIKNLGRPVCTVLSELRSIINYVDNRYPSLQFAYDDNWQTWITILGPGQSDACGSFPYFKADVAGISVLSKYGNPSQNTCDHPTAQEMEEQLIDLKPVVKAYSKSRKIFVWQLNQHWYPGQNETLQLFKQMKRVFGWQRYFLFGPTVDNAQQGEWGYNTRASRNGCFPTGFHWYLPAREYLIQLSEGAKSKIRFQGPGSAPRGTPVSFSGTIESGGNGIPVNRIELQIRPQADALQTFTRDLVAPPKAVYAVIGARVNTQLIHNINDPAQFLLDRAGLFRKGSTTNLIPNSDFNNNLDFWFSISTAPVTVVTNGTEKSVSAICSKQQTISLTSTPAVVIPGRTYTVRFEARILQEARANGYFFVSWNQVSEIKRDRIFMTAPTRRTVAITASRPNGSFFFDYPFADSGGYVVSALFPGSSSFQPSLDSRGIVVN